MNEKVKREIYSLGQSVVRVVEESRNVASSPDVEPELLEELQQIAIAMYYEMQVLTDKLGLTNPPGRDLVQIES